MGYIATQQINGAHGRFDPGDEIDDDTHPDVLRAWEAAGIIEKAGKPAAAASSSEPSKPSKPKPRKVEKATAPKPETAPQPRFVETATDVQQRRFIQDEA